MLIRCVYVFKKGSLQLWSLLWSPLSRLQAVHQQVAPRTRFLLVDQTWIQLIYTFSQNIGRLVVVWHWLQTFLNAGGKKQLSGNTTLHFFRKKNLVHLSGRLSDAHSWLLLDTVNKYLLVPLERYPPRYAPKKGHLHKSFQYLGCPGLQLLESKLKYCFSESSGAWAPAPCTSAALLQ